MRKVVFIFLHCSNTLLLYSISLRVKLVPVMKEALCSFQNTKLSKGLLKSF